MVLIAIFRRACYYFWKEFDKNGMFFEIDKEMLFAVVGVYETIHVKMWFRWAEKWINLHIWQFDVWMSRIVDRPAYCVVELLFCRTEWEGSQI